MNDVFDKIIEKLKEKRIGYLTAYVDGIDYSINIVKHEAEIYNNGWTQCKDKQPNKSGRYLVTVKNEFTGKKEVTIAMWKQRQGGSYGWYRQGVHNKVIAWQPLPEEYAE